MKGKRMIAKKTKDFFMLPYSALDKNWEEFSEYFNAYEMDGLKEAATLSWPPETVLLDISTVCNLDCPFCYNHYGSPISIFEKKRNSKETLLDFVKRNAPFKYLAFSGAGEPFLYPDTFELLEELENFCEGFHISTNLQTLDEEKIKRLAKLKIKSIIVSADASDKEGYEIFRKNGNYEKFVCNLKLMHQAFGRRLSIMSVVFKQNSASILNFPKFFRELGLDNMLLHIVKGIAHPNLDLKSCSTMNADDMLHFVEEIYDQSLAYNCSISLSGAAFPQHKLSQKLKQYKGLYTSYCMQPFHHLQINIDGEVNYCCGGFQNLPKDAFKDNPKKHWNAEEALKLRIMMAAGYEITACQKLCNKKFDFKVMDADVIINRLKGFSKDAFMEVVKIENVCNFLKQQEYYKNLNIAVYGVGNFTKNLFKELAENVLDVKVFFDDSSHGEMIQNKRIETFDVAKLNEYSIDTILIITSLYEENIASKIASLSDINIVKLISESEKR